MHQASLQLPAVSDATPSKHLIPESTGTCLIERIRLCTLLQTHGVYLGHM